jgi:DNA-binding MarR family transcriptional regulator
MRAHPPIKLLCKPLDVEEQIQLISSIRLFHPSSILNPLFPLSTSPHTPVCGDVVYDICMEKLKTPKQMERHLKGIANHHRIQILLLISNRPSITLEGIIEELNGNDKTLGEHARRLTQAGLINKNYKGRFIEHTLSPYGKAFVQFLKSFQRT